MHSIMLAWLVTKICLYIYRSGHGWYYVTMLHLNGLVICHHRDQVSLKKYVYYEFEHLLLWNISYKKKNENETLTNNLKIGIIRLLRKGNKDPTITGNYRPISLLSIHYKLGSCAITQRIKNAVTSVIGRQQKAYVNNNIIGSCIINLIKLIYHGNKKSSKASSWQSILKKLSTLLTKISLKNSSKPSISAKAFKNGSNYSLKEGKLTSS